MIIRRKHLVLASLTLMLGIAVFVHFLIAGNNEITPTDAQGNYGEAQFVSSSDDSSKTGNNENNNSAQADEVSDVDSYFVQARLDKQESRDKAAELLKSIYTGGDLNADELQAVAQDAVSMTSLIESESKIETTLKAQGFADVICYLNGKSANVIVKADEFQTADAAKVKNTLLSEVEIDPSNITIIPVK